MKKFFSFLGKLVDLIFTLIACFYLPLLLAFLFKSFSGFSDAAAMIYGVGVCIIIPVWGMASRVKDISNRYKEK